MDHRGGGPNEVEMSRSRSSALQQRDVENRRLREKVQVEQSRAKESREQVERLNARLNQVLDELKHVKGALEEARAPRARARHATPTSAEERRGAARDDRGGGGGLRRRGPGATSAGSTQAQGVDTKNLDRDVGELMNRLLQLDHRLRSSAGGMDFSSYADADGDAFDASHLKDKFTPAGKKAGKDLDTITITCGQEECTFRITNNYTFALLQEDAARYWDFPPETAVLDDGTGRVWPAEGLVREELSKLDTVPTLKLKVKPSLIRQDQRFDDSALDRIGSHTGLLSHEAKAAHKLDLPTGEEDVASSAGSQVVFWNPELQKQAELREEEEPEYHEVHKSITERSGSLLELLIFFTFMGLLLTIFVIRRDVKEDFLTTNSLRQNLIDVPLSNADVELKFSDISSDREWWDWLQNFLLTKLYPTTRYNGSPLTTFEKEFILEYYRPISTRARIRQLRVKRELCEIKDGSGTQDVMCWPHYNDKTRSEESFGPNEIYQYSSSSQTDYPRVEGAFSTYDGGGFVVDLPLNDRDAAVAAVAKMRNDLWTDKQTRAVLITWNMHNVNMNRLSVNRLLFEFTQQGTVVPSYSFKVVRISFYSDWWREGAGGLSATMILEIICLIYVCFFLWDQGKKAYAMKQRDLHLRAYFDDHWNLFDIFMSITFIAIFITEMAFLGYSRRRNFSLETPECAVPLGTLCSDHIEFEDLARLYNGIFYAFGFLGFCLFIKAIKYINVSKRVHLLWATFIRALPDLVGFTVVFFCLLLGFGLCGHELFGVQIVRFRTLGESMWSLFGLILGSWDYQELKEIHNIIGPIYFAFFMLIMYFTAASAFVAIIVNAYNKIRNAGITAFKIGKEWSHLFHNWRRFLCPQHYRGMAEPTYDEEMPAKYY